MDIGWLALIAFYMSFGIALVWSKKDQLIPAHWDPFTRFLAIAVSMAAFSLLWIIPITAGVIVGTLEEIKDRRRRGPR